MMQNKALVLYVDDESLNLKVFKALFEDDFEVYTALSAKLGSELLKEHEFAVVVSDQRMPEITGAEFLESVNKEFPYATRVLLTGFSDMDALRDAVNKGNIYQFCEKPFTYDSLLPVLKRAAEVYLLKKENELLLHELEGRNADLNDLTYRLKHEIVDKNAALEELEHTQRKLKRSEQRFKDISHAMGDWLWELDEDGRYIFSSGNLRSILGYSSKEVIGFAPWDLVAEEDSEQVQDLFMSHFKEQTKILDSVSVWKHKNGEQVYISTSGVPCFDSRQRLAGFRGVCKDVTEKHKTQNRIRKSEAMFRGLIEVSPDAILIVNNQRKIIMVNRQCESCFGYKREELLDQPVEMLVPAHFIDHSQYMANYMKAAEARLMAGASEVKGLKKDGSHFAAEITLGPLYSFEGLIVSVTVRDISLRKRQEAEIKELNSSLEERVTIRTAELEDAYRKLVETNLMVSNTNEELSTAYRALKNSEQRLELAFSGSGYAWWDLDLRNMQIMAHPQRWALLGLTPVDNQLSLDEWKSLFHPADVNEFETGMQALLSGERSHFEATYRMQDIDGGWLWFYDRGKVFEYGRDKKPLRLVGTSQDITAQKNAEEERNNMFHEMQVSVKKLNFLFEVSNLIHVYGSRKRIFREVVKMLPASFQCPEHACARIEYESLSFHSEGFKASGCSISSPLVIENECIGKVEVFYSEAYGIDNEEPFLMDERHLLRVVARLLAQMVKRKTTEAALRHARLAAEVANKAKSEFLANMSHEIRTPMNAVLGFSDLLNSQITDPVQKNYLNSIRTSGKSLLSLINDILDLSKIESGRMELNYEPVNFRWVLEELKQIFGLKAQEKSLDLIMDVQADFPDELLLDEVRIRQVLINLVGNALKFTNTGYVKVTLCSTNLQEHLVGSSVEHTIDLTICVEDTGVGISGEFQKRIFESFTQQDSDTTKTYGGTGLGLSISKRLVELMDGAISVKSKLNQGSTFIVQVGAVRISTQKSVPTNQQLAGLLGHIQFKKANVLLVDDIHTNRTYISSVLAGTGIEVFEAGNGQEGLRILDEIDIDLVITDLKMPIMDGFMFAKKVRQKNKKIPILATTASVLRNNSDRLEEANFDGLLFKPIKADLLLDEISRFIEHTIDEEGTRENQGNIANTTAPVNKLPEAVYNLLRGKFMDEWKEFEQKQPMQRVKAFAQRLQELAEQHECLSLLEYANSLSEAIDSFDVDGMLQALNQYPAWVGNAKTT